MVAPSEARRRRTFTRLPKIPNRTRAPKAKQCSLDAGSFAGNEKAREEQMRAAVALANWHSERDRHTCHTPAAGSESLQVLRPRRVACWSASPARATRAAPNLCGGGKLEVKESAFSAFMTIQ